MGCFHPIQAYQFERGEIRFSQDVAFDGRVRQQSSARALLLPCGKCDGCLFERSRQWAVRCMHECQMHESSVFATLTYAESPWSLDYHHFQLFMRSLRRRAPGVRFFMCGEYGERFFRPHYHACLFGVDFPDRKLFSDNRDHGRLYTSDILSKCWPHGFCSIGDVTFDSAAYVARYVLKKRFGAEAAEHYQGRTPEFCHMSKRPDGIGASWYRRFKSDVFPHGYVVVEGSKCRPPRYYDKLFMKEESDEVELLRMERAKLAAERAADNTEERLLVKEKILRARIALFKKPVE